MINFEGLTMNQLAERNATLVSELEQLREIANCPAGVDLQDHLRQLAEENVELKAIVDSVTDLSNEPQYHSEGMGCGLEDRGITDRYEAMEYGWDEAMERVYGEVIPCAEELEFPATDRIIAGLKARGVEEFAAHLRTNDNEASVCKMFALGADEYARQLREGGQMRERGMIFNAEMVRAILYGRKTQTRRPVKFPVIDKDAICELAGNELAGELSAGNYRNSSFGKPGDRIWVRETWARYNIDQESHDMAYRATTPADWPEEGRWRPSIHMPRWASRITLEITGVRVERLNDISECDAAAEGVSQLSGGFWKHYQPGWTQHQLSARGSFVTLWKSIYGDESLQANPWVYVIEFKRVDGNGKGAA